MDTFKIAFDTVVIGALALPWVLLLLDLFLRSEKKGHAPGQTFLNLSPTLKFIKDNELSTVAAVLLFAMAYVMGAGISRLSGDFLNDDDWGLEVFSARVPTKDKIHYQVYCNPNQKWIVDPCPCVKSDPHKPCPFGGSLTPVKDGDEEELHIRAKRFFELQEGALLNQGDKTPGRMSHIYQQLVVLRGAVLDGVVLTVLLLLCFFAKQKMWGRGAVTNFCVLFLGWAAVALRHHLCELGRRQYLIEPPMLECSFIVIVVLAGIPLIWKGAPNHAYGIGFLVSFAMTLLAYAGWWWTEIVYDELVLNLYMAKSQGLLVNVPH